MAWCMIWPGGHGMIYGMAWRPWHRICYGLAGFTLHMVWLGEVCHSMWKVTELHASRHCHGLYSRSHVEWPMPFGGPVHTYKTRSQVEGLLHECKVHTFSPCSLWAGIVNTEIVNL